MPYCSLGIRTCQCLLVVCAGTVLATAVGPFIGAVAPQTQQKQDKAGMWQQPVTEEIEGNFIFAPTNPISILQTPSGFSFLSSAPVLPLIWTMSCHFYPTRLQLALVSSFQKSHSTPSSSGHLAATCSIIASKQPSLATDTKDEKGGRPQLFTAYKCKSVLSQERNYSRIS